MHGMSNSGADYRLGDMTGAGFARIAAANPVILLPLGSHEDHGPVLPMGDYILAETLAVRIAAAATARGTQTFVAPCLPFGVADYFGSSAGGMAISAGNFRGMLLDLLGALLRHGLTRIVILNGHGGNAPVIHDVTLDIRRERNIVIPSFYLWKAARGLMEELLGAERSHRFGHGAEPLLSLNLALRPDSVTLRETVEAPVSSMLGLPVSGFGTLDFFGVTIDAPVEFGEVPRGAIEAALPLASAALGAAVADELVAVGAKFVAYFAAAG
jgi:creatinine amidohydrolase